MSVAINSDPIEQLLERFYEWEVRGRGWQLWGDRVYPEPPFEPFRGNWVDLPPQFDDGRQHTVVSGWVERLRGLFAPRVQPPQLPDAHPDPTPRWDEDEPDSREFQLVLSPDFHSDQVGVEQFLLTMSACKAPICFEAIGTDNTIALQFVAREPDTTLLEFQLKAHFPGASVLPHQGLLRESWEAAGEYSHVLELGLAREFMLPLMPAKSVPEILVPLSGALESVSSDELALVQVVFAPVRNRWSESILRACTYADGEPVFEGFRDILAGAKLKVSRPLFATIVRLACKADDPHRATELARHLFGSFSGLSNPGGNELTPLPNNEYDAEQHEDDLLSRRTQRTGMLLNSTELFAVVQLPSPSVQSPKLRGSVKTTKAAPSIVLQNKFILGDNHHAGRRTVVGLNAEQRSRHMHIIGASGTGKSQLLLSLIAQDMKAGTGLALLDPHGDLVDEVLARVPENRMDDVVLLDPSDEQYTVGFNILSAKTEIEKTVLASDLVAVFQRLSTSWGDQMTSVLGNAILAFLDRPEVGTLADLRRFLIEPAFRAQILGTVRDPEIQYYWKKQFPLLRGNPQASVLTRLDMFLRRKPIRQMVCLKDRALDFGQIMDAGKIFLARIPHGLIGEENGHLLGTLLVSRFHQLAMARQQKEAAQRRPFFLYIDEFHHFVTPSMASILTEARKYRLGLILAHQELRQLESRGTDITSAVLSNPYTRICFRVGDQDAKKLADGFSLFESSDLLSLGTGEAICRVERSDFDFNLTTRLLPPLDEAGVEERRNSVVARSREQYAVLRSSLVEPVSIEPESAKTAKVEVLPAIPPDAPEPVIPETPKPKAVKKPSIAAEEPALLGRGGAEHKYLQQLIKQWAQGMGYRASIEAPLPAGGSVDILLEKGDRKIACETSITNTPAYEVENIRKSLEAQYQFVAVVATDIKHRSRIEIAAKTALSPAQMEHVRFFSPEELFTFIQELEINDAKSERTVCGYKVKTSLKVSDAAEQAMRKQAVAQVVAKSMTRLRKKKQ